MSNRFPWSDKPCTGVLKTHMIPSKAEVVAWMDQVNGNQKAFHGKLVNYYNDGKRKFDAWADTACIKDYRVWINEEGKRKVDIAEMLKSYSGKSTLQNSLTRIKNNKLLNEEKPKYTIKKNTSVYDNDDRVTLRRKLDELIKINIHYKNLIDDLSLRSVLIQHLQKLDDFGYPEIDISDVPPQLTVAQDAASELNPVKKGKTLVKGGRRLWNKLTKNTRAKRMRARRKNAKGRGKRWRQLLSNLWNIIKGLINIRQLIAFLIAYIICLLIEKFKEKLEPETILSGI